MNLNVATAGIRHVMAISGDPQRNLDFYEGILGLWPIRRAVNSDDPGTYYLYYGDGMGNPGIIMTFFSWAGALKGMREIGQAAATAFSIREGAVCYWSHRLIEHGATFKGRPELLTSLEGYLS